MLPLDGGRRSVQAVGARAADAHGRTLADVVWMRDATHLGEPAAPDGGDDALRERYLFTHRYVRFAALLASMDPVAADDQAYSA